jgi:hypothetical protein
MTFLLEVYMFVVKATGGVCSKTTIDGIGGSKSIAGGLVTIEASVGAKGVNRKNDVTTIQDALNRAPVAQGGPAPPLAVDGRCGPKTIKAIQTFQLKHFGWSGADGLIEPGRQTNLKLNQIVGGPAAKTSVGGKTSGSPIEMPDLSAGLARALQFIRAARHNLNAASLYVDREDEPPGPFEVFSREFRMRSLNRVFDIDKVPTPHRRKVFNLIDKTFRRMDQVFQRPGGLWGPATFEPDQFQDKNLAYTNYGGFFRSGQFRFHKSGGKMRLDSIFICEPFLKHMNRVDNQALIHVHELAHFVGHPDLIDDHAYNTNPTKMDKLPPHMRALNAEHYSNFAWEAKHPGVRPPI